MGWHTNEKSKHRLRVKPVKWSNEPWLDGQAQAVAMGGTWMKFHTLQLALWSSTWSATQIEWSTKHWLGGNNACPHTCLQSAPANFLQSGFMEPLLELLETSFCVFLLTNLMFTPPRYPQIDNTNSRVSWVILHSGFLEQKYFYSLSLGCQCTG